MPETKLDFEKWVLSRKAAESASKGDAFGEAFLAEMDAVADIERSGWAFELAGRVAARLQATDAADLRKQPVVFWSKHRTAFTVSGRYIYVSRRLLEEALPEDAVAFVFAHELAHHRLGHLKQVLTDLKTMGPLSVAAMAAQLANHFLRSPAHEASADAWALSRCLDAGYDGHACLRVFDVLQNIAEDYGDLDMAYGRGDSEQLATRELNRTARPKWRNALDDAVARLDRGAWEVLRGHPSLCDRRAALEATIAKESKERSSP
jgi:predicted Zn-dependent protease